MKKEIKHKKIFYDCKRWSQWSNESYKWGEVKKLLTDNNIELQDDDYLMIEFEDAYQEGDSARDAFYGITVWRDVEETDEEFEKRKDFLEKRKAQNKKDRYEQYLKLKKEFETWPIDGEF
jgi:hypothetical protein